MFEENPVLLFPNGNIMKKEKTTERDREATEMRLLRAVEALGRENGFEKIGVNAVAAASGVSKILIYRYFGSVEGLMAAYIRRYDFWINLPQEIPPLEQLPGYLKEVFRSFVGRLRSDLTMKRLYRWELSSDNDIVRKLREQREQNGLALIGKMAGLAGFPEERIAMLATFLTASAAYLAMLEEHCPVYNGMPIGASTDWEPIYRGADLFIDQFFSCNSNI